MKQRTRQKARLIINIVLTIFSLCALTISIIAWFSTKGYANIDSLDLIVDRKEIELLEKPNSYLFPCATKIREVSHDDFNSYCFVTGTYVIEGEGKLIMDVTSSNGVLGYVLDGTEGEDYYSVITNALEKQLGSDWKTKSYNNSEKAYDDLKKALYEINTSRPVGTSYYDADDLYPGVDYYTKVTVVCWVEYTDLISNKLNMAKDAVFDINEVDDFTVDVIFVA